MDEPSQTNGSGDLEPKEGGRAQETYQFHTGEKLTVSETSSILNARPVRMVFCAGAQWAGKTTFLARIGELFRNGLMTEFQFAGSNTLCAFERASWLATINSGAPRPETKRSVHSEKDRFYHLKVCAKSDPESLMDLLISDLPGETFPNAVWSREFCSQQRALVRADHLLVFIDCRCLVDDAKRHSERDNVFGFLRHVAKIRELDPLQVHVIFSRWDYVINNSNHAQIIKYCESIEADLKARYSGCFSGFTFWRIAARPEDMKPTDTEIQMLFSSWIGCQVGCPPPMNVRSQAPAREFNAFGLL